jgi:hypothetical protein
MAGTEHVTAVCPLNQSIKIFNSDRKDPLNKTAETTNYKQQQLKYVEENIRKMKKYIKAV